MNISGSRDIVDQMNLAECTLLVTSGNGSTDNKALLLYKPNHQIMRMMRMMLLRMTLVNTNNLLVAKEFLFVYSFCFQQDDSINVKMFQV